jgi:hypothetical protein
VRVFGEGERGKESVPLPDHHMDQVLPEHRESQKLPTKKELEATNMKGVCGGEESEKINK